MAGADGREPIAGHDAGEEFSRVQLAIVQCRKRPRSGAICRVVLFFDLDWRGFPGLFRPIWEDSSRFALI